MNRLPRKVKKKLKAGTLSITDFNKIAFKSSVSKTIKEQVKVLLEGMKNENNNKSQLEI